MTAPWDDPDTKADWDKHASETYYSYWEQYSYWAAQGWTIEQPPCNGNTDIEAAAEVPVIETHPEGCSYGPTGAGSQQRIEDPHDDVEILSDLIGQKCTLKAARNSIPDSQTDQCVREECVGQYSCSDNPCEGNDRKRASSSSQQNVAESTGNSSECLFFWFVFEFYRSKVILLLLRITSRI